MDAHDTTKAPVEIPLPMLSTGGFARDIQCTSEGLCLASLTWDGALSNFQQSNFATFVHFS
eukprot:56350-Amphidinium_carterae.1